ncbi:MAG: GntR family transcriptional regulator [Alphaproteobacteria bacterium]|nr:MAG: GntR family transcriptional regulator [Alphaproteobacteria bacterium]
MAFGTDDQLVERERPASIYERLRDDIAEGRLQANERLKASVLAARYHTSTNPVREALQQLRGEGFVVFSQNKGARVRPVDEDFARDVYEIEALIAPYLTHWFVSIASQADIVRLEAAQQEMEDLNFRDHELHSVLDRQFHQIIYERHYNRQAVDMSSKRREILHAIAKRFPFSSSRQREIMTEHQQLIAAIKSGNAEGAVEVMRRHIMGSGRHIIDHMRAERARTPKASSAP